MIVTIDGPAGSGKSTVAKRVADKLKWMYLDTGATYRCAALIAQQLNLTLNNKTIYKLVRKILDTNISFKRSPQTLKVFLDNKDVSNKIRTEKIAQLASKLATKKQIRDALVQKQKEIAKQYKNIITEGRDQGSVVFPEADVKFYLDATPEERAKRRYNELRQQRKKADLKEILQAIKQRDLRDKTRKASPLIIPNNAIIIDTTDLTINEVTEKIISFIKSKQKKSKKRSKRKTTSRGNRNK